MTADTTYTTSLMLGPDHAVPIESLGGVATVSVAAGGSTVYYADNPTVSPTTNQGSIAGGVSRNFAAPAWIISASLVSVSVSWNPSASGASPIVTTRPTVTGVTALPAAASGAAFADTLTGNTTYSAPTGAVAGAFCQINLQIAPNVSGPWTITWPGVVTWANGAAPPNVPVGQVMMVQLTSFDGGVTFRGSWLATSTVPAGTLLPVSPTDGQLYTYIADSGNGVIWTLRWNAGANAWQFTGGGSLYQELLGPYVYSGQTTYIAIGCAVTVPRSGTYEIEFGSTLQNQASSQNAIVSPALGAAAAQDNDCVSISPSATAGVNVVSCSRVIRRTLVAGDSVALNAKASTATASSQFYRNWIAVRPVQVT